MKFLKKIDEFAYVSAVGPTIVAPTINPTRNMVDVSETYHPLPQTRDHWNEQNGRLMLTTVN